MNRFAILPAFLCFVSINEIIAQAARNNNAPSIQVQTATTPANSSYNSNYNSSPISNRYENVSQSRGESFRNNVSADDTRAQSAGTAGYSYDPGAGVSAGNNYSGGAALTASATQPTPGNNARRTSGVPYYPYYSSCFTKNRSKHHYCDSARINCPPLPPPEFYFGDAYWRANHLDLLYIQYISDYSAMMNEPAKADNNIVQAAFDGYVVYVKDTLTGIVTMNPGSVYIETATGQNHAKTSKARFNYRNLTAITLYKGNKTLYLTRLNDNDARLWRVVHSGRLNIYDDNNSFLSAGNINRQSMRVQLPGELTYVDISSKKHLVWCINRTYGMYLKAGNQSWKSLIELIDRLD
jgi:hypothetical protein